MKSLAEIKEAIIIVKDGYIDITFGANLNKMNENYHNNVSIEIHSGGNEILAKGRKAKFIELDREIFEGEEAFKAGCEQLKGFEEKIETIEEKKFSWKTFRIIKNVIKSVKSEWYFKTRYSYKEKYWNSIEYKSNNWTLTELKSNDNRGKT
jgi:hypothetical protein